MVNNSSNTENDLQSLFIKELKYPKLSPYKDRYFLCENGCICSDNTNVPRQIIISLEENVFQLVSHRCWDMVLEPLQNYISSNTFSSPSILRVLFYSAKMMKEESHFLRAVDLLKNHSYLHPPCRANMRDYYKKVFLEVPSEINKHPALNYCFNDLLKDVEVLNIGKVVKKLETSENVFRKKRKEHIADLSPEKENENPEINLKFTINYLKPHLQLAESDQNFTKLSGLLSGKRITKSDESIDGKPYELLQIMLDILEQDLYVWLTNYNKDSASTLNKLPLVGELGWEGDTTNLGEVNDYCRKIFAIFKNCHLDYKYVFARYICLLSEVVRASDENTDKCYPYFGFKCEAFSRALSNSISDNSSQEEIVEMVGLLCPHWLRFIVSSYLLDSPLSSSTIYSMSSIVRILQRNLSKYPVVRATSVTPNGKTRKKINKRNYAGESVLHRLCIKNNFAKLEEQLKYPDINVNAKDNLGFTPLHHAVHRNSIECIQSLIKFRLPPIDGAAELNVHIFSNRGFTPLMEAVDAENLEIINLLLQYGGGVSVYTKNNAGLTALDLCENNQHIKDLLLAAWNSDISSYRYLNMSDTNLKIFQNLLVSYCRTYQIESLNQKNLDYGEDDKVYLSQYKFNYEQYLEDVLCIRDLVELVERLARHSETKLVFLLGFLKSKYQ